MDTYVFGPVPSRRLGRSLGVDLIPHKTCSYDCTYCQVGRTDRKTTTRREWVPMEAVLDQLRDKLSCRPDYITFAGAGEPTLYSRLGELIARIKEMTDVPVAVLTNGSLLSDPQVRKELLDCDLVVPSLDVADEELFRQVNRPHADLTLDQVIQGLVSFRKEYRGKFWLEILLVKDVTGTDDHVARLAQIVREIEPDLVQINTVTRPPAESTAEPVLPADLDRLAKFFAGKVEVIAQYQAAEPTCNQPVTQEDILLLMERHPATVAEAAASLGVREQVVRQRVDELVAGGKLVPDQRSDGTYYRARNGFE